MLPSRHWVVLAVLGACTPTLIAPIQGWHHHAAMPADDEPAAIARAHGRGEDLLRGVNRDGYVTFADINPFVLLLTQGVVKPNCTGRVVDAD